MWRIEDSEWKKKRGGGEWGCLGASPMPVKPSQMEGIGGLSYCVQKGYTAPWASVSPPVCDGSISSSSRLISSTPNFLWGDPFPHPSPSARQLAHLLQKLGGPQQLQGLQMGVEKGAGLQVASQLALNDVAHGAVIRQADESRSVHEVGAAEGESWVVAPDPGPAHLRPLSPPSRACAGWASTLY